MGNDKITENRQFIADTIKNFLDSGDWSYEYDSDQIVFCGEIMIDCSLGSVKFWIFVDDNSAICYHVAPIIAKTKERGLLAEFLTRVNSNLKRGNFDLDFSNGEISYKHRISLADIKENAAEEIAWLVYLGCHMFDDYSNGMLAVSFGVTPEQAYIDCCKAKEEAETPEEK